MENATEALKMAFGVMMFILALTLSISCFSQATSSVSRVVTIRDRETQYMYVTPSKKSNRIVGVETIIPTLYKAYKENFRVVFLDKDGSSPLGLYYYTDSYGEARYRNPDGSITTNKEINYFDLEQEVIPNATEAIAHLNILLASRTGYNKNDNKYFNQFKYTEGIFAYLQDKKFEEVLGEYYQEDAAAGEETDGIEINKTKKRVITYILQ